MDIGPSEGERNPGQAGTAADIGNALPRHQEFADRTAIQDVAIPESLDFAGADQTAFDAGARKQCGIFGSRVEPVAEQSVRGLWRRGRVTMFHVKHPPTPRLR
ncbi:hypothetical protein TUM20984_30040 [Mycobacterium antarcticum]|nr:hypothetical protein TUM20984_30040 [Mycolicibacterium sp. TUM20984]